MTPAISGKEVVGRNRSRPAQAPGNPGLRQEAASRGGQPAAGRARCAAVGKELWYGGLDAFDVFKDCGSEGEGRRRRGGRRLACGDQ